MRFFLKRKNKILIHFDVLTLLEIVFKIAYNFKVLLRYN
jgi:hypothetical protein